MIYECENFLPASYFSNPNLFPRYILVRRPANDDQDGGDGTEWQGFVKQMKRHFEKETFIIRTELEKQRKSIITEVRKDVNQVQTKIDLRIDEI